LKRGVFWYGKKYYGIERGQITETVVVKPERKQGGWRAAADTQVDRLNRGLSALRRALRGLRRMMRDIAQSEREAVRRADEFFGKLPDELPHLSHHPEDQPDPTEKRPRRR